MIFLKNHHRFSLLISQFIGLLIIAQITACNWSKNKGNSSNEANITMQIPSEPIIGDQKTIEVTFALEDKAQIANLANFTLDVKIKKQVGDTGNAISYGSKQKTTHINGPLKEILSLDTLNAANSSCKLAINFLPTPNTTELELEVRLLNKAGTVKEGTVIWKATPKFVELSITRTTSEELKATQRTVSVEIKNKGTATIEKGELKLWIEREGGSNGTIQNATQINNTNAYTVDLPYIGAESMISYTMTIDPKEDKNFTLNFRLQHKGQDTATPFKVTWERGPELKIVEVTHDRKGTKQVQVVVENVGTSSAKNVELTSSITTKGATIDGNAKKAVKIDELQPGQKKVIDNLGVLDFGKKGKKENDAAACEFGVSCAGTCPKAPKPTIIEQKIFLKDADIVFTPKLTYNKDKEEISYLIKNSGKDTAKGVKLEIKNVSSDSEGELATINGKQDQVMDLGDLLSNKELDLKLKLDLKDAEKATFEFNLIHHTNPEEQKIKQGLETFEAKPIQLSLAVISPTKSNAEQYLLYGAENQVKLKIEQSHNSRSININHVVLSIKVPAGDGTTVSHIINGPAIAELTGANLGKIGDIITLYINPNLEAQEANVSIELYYREELIGAPILIQWREYAMMLEGSGRLVGEQIGYFTIFSVSDLDRDAITVSLESEKGTTFQFYDKMSGNTEAVLADLTDYDTKGSVSNRSKLAPIYFTISEANGQKEAAVNVVIKRKSKVIATHTTNWIDKGISIELTTNNFIEVETLPITVTIKNTGDKNLKLSKVKARVENTENLPFSFGKMEGTTIEGTLEDIIGTKELNSKSQNKPLLRPDALLKDKIVTGVTLTLFEEKNGKEEILVQTHIIYYTADLYNTQVPIGNNIYSNILKQIVTNKDNPGFLAYLLTSLETGIEVCNKILVKYEQIADNHPEFNEAIRLTHKFLYDKIKLYNTLVKKTKEAIAELGDQDEIIVQWAKHSTDKVNSAIEILKGGPEKLKSLNDHQAITKALIGKYERSKDVDQQTLQGVYEYYQDKISQIKSFLEKHATTALPDTPSISQIKELYNRMVAEQPNIRNAVKQTFDAGFKKVNNDIEQEQAKLNPSKVTSKRQKPVMEFYNMLVKQFNTLYAWDSLLDKSELMTEPAALYKDIAARYQKLAEKNKIFAKHIYNKSKPGNVTRVAELGEIIARKAFIMAQSTKNQTIESVAIETTEAAKETTKDAIEAWKLYERARGVRNVSFKKPLQILDINNDLNTLPTVLQSLQANLENLKDSLKARGEKKNRFSFKWLRPKFLDNNKTKDDEENTDKGSNNQEDTDQKDADEEDANEE